MGKRPSPTMIGAFVVGAIVLVVAAVATFGSGRLFTHKLRFVTLFAGSVNGLDVGAQVKFRGVPVGSVTDIRLALPGIAGTSFRIPVLLEIDQDRAAGLGAANVLADPNRARILMEQGLRAQLQLQSVITGVLFIALDIMPDTPKDLVLPADSGYDEIPTVPTALEQVQVKVLDIFDRLSKIDFEALGKSLNGAIEGVNRLANSPDMPGLVAAAHGAIDEVRDLAHELKPRVGELATSLNGTSDEVRASLKRLDVAMAALQKILDPQAPMLQGMTGTLTDLSAAARAVRGLVEYLDRNPNAILTGRKTK